MRKIILLLMTISLIVSLFTGCSNTTDDSSSLNDSQVSSSKIEYWPHTIDSSEIYYISASPYGYYEVIYYDSRLSGEYWYDVWFVTADGSWIRLAPMYDENISVWYNVIHLYDGSLAFDTAIDMTGQTLIIFRAEASAMQSMGLRKMEDFNAKEYFDQWPPENW